MNNLAAQIGFSTGDEATSHTILGMLSQLEGIALKGQLTAASFKADIKNKSRSQAVDDCIELINASNLFAAEMEKISVKIGVASRKMAEDTTGVSVNLASQMTDSTVKAFGAAAAEASSVVKSALSVLGIASPALTEKLRIEKIGDKVEEAAGRNIRADYDRYLQEYKSAQTAFVEKYSKSGDKNTQILIWQINTRAKVLTDLFTALNTPMRSPMRQFFSSPPSKKGGRKRRKTKLTRKHRV